MPAKMIAVRTRLLMRSSMARPSSSMANTMPVSGVLNIAAKPAALPARIRPFSR